MMMSTADYWSPRRDPRTGCRFTEAAAASSFSTEIAYAHRGNANLLTHIILF